MCSSSSSTAFRYQVPGTVYPLPPQYHENVRPNPRAVGSIDVSIYATSPPSCTVYLYIIYYIQSCFYYYINAVRLTSAPSPPTDAPVIPSSGFTIYGDRDGSEPARAFTASTPIFSWNHNRTPIWTLLLYIIPVIINRRCIIYTGERKKNCSLDCLTW